MKKTISILIFLLIVSILLNLYSFEGLNKLKKVETENKKLETKNTAISTDLELLSQAISSYFKETGKECKEINPRQTKLLANCINNLVKEITSKPKLKEGSFRNFFEGKPGTLVLINDGDAPLESKDFRLYLNGILEDDDGCEMRGEIKPGYACKLNFYHPVNIGDNLEVFYDNKSVFIINY